jgi:hypothetical protein
VADNEWEIMVRRMVNQVMGKLLPFALTENNLGAKINNNVIGIVAICACKELRMTLVFVCLKHESHIQS